MTTAASPLQRLGLLLRLHWRDLRRLLRYSLVLVAAPRLGQRCICSASGGTYTPDTSSAAQIARAPGTSTTTPFACTSEERWDWDEHAGCFFVDSDCVRSEWRLGWDVGKYLIVDALQFGRAPDCLAVEGKRWPWRIVGGALFSWCGGRGRQVGGWYDFPGYAYDIAGTRFSG